MGWPFFVRSPYEDPVRAREGLVCCAGVTPLVLRL
jgi:hypothetical protein